MANPPFNVDLVDAERIKSDPRLPFGLPGVNKDKKVSNGNYLWISYFWSYLGEKGRAGFVMSSQASSAGHGERDVRRKIVETGDVDVMISIRSNFFYTRTVPCELWFFDRGKPKILPSPSGRGAGGEGGPLNAKGRVLMIDARNVFRKVNRTINDFSPEQMANLSAIVWLYRGQKDRFLALVERYLKTVAAECIAAPAAIEAFEATLAQVQERIRTPHAPREAGVPRSPVVGPRGKRGDSNDEPHTEREEYDALAEFCSAVEPYEKDLKTLLADLGKFAQGIESRPPATVRASTRAARRLTRSPSGSRDSSSRSTLLRSWPEAHTTKFVASWPSFRTVLLTLRVRSRIDRRAVAKLLKQLEDERHAAVEQLRYAVYFHRQAAWLLDRFPEGKLVDVPGLVKLVTKVDIEAADWSLTPGRYVGVAPAEVDEDFDFEQVMRDIHTELADLNKEAIDLASKIQTNFEEVGA